MKLIFNEDEVAAALGQTVEDFNLLRPQLEAEGFPKPVRGLGKCWSIMDVIQWVNRPETPTLESVLAEIEAAGLEDELLGPRPRRSPEPKLRIIEGAGSRRSIRT